MSTQNPNRAPDIPGGNGNLNEKMKAFIERNLQNKFSEKVDERTPVNAKIFDKIAEYAKNNVEIREEIDDEIHALLLADFRRAHPNASEEEFANIFEAQKSKILDFALKILSNRKIATENHRKMINKFFKREIIGDFAFLEQTKQLSILELNGDFSDAKKIIDFYRNRGVDIKKFRKKPQELEQIIEQFFTNEDDFYNNLSDEEFERLNAEFIKFQRTGIVSEELIALLIVGQGVNAEPEKVAKLCMELMPSLPYSSIKNYILTTESEQVKFEKKIFKDFLRSHEIELGADFEEKFLDFRAHFNAQDYDFLLEDFQGYFDDSEQFYAKVKDMLLGDENFRSDVAEQFADLTEEISEERESIENEDFARILQEKLMEKIEELDENHKEKMGDNWRENVEKAVLDNYMCLHTGDGKVGNWQILEFNEEEDEDGESEVYITLLKQGVDSFADGTLYWRGVGEYQYTLDEFVEFFVENLEKSEISEAYFDESIAEPTEQTQSMDEAQEVNNELNTLADLIAKLDEIDPDNATKGFSIGMTFCLMGKKGPEYVKVRSIDESTKTLSIELCDGTVIPNKEDPSPFTWGELLEFIGSSKNFFRRLGNVETPENFAENASFLPKDSSEKLAKIPGIEFKNNKLSITETIDGQVQSTELYGFKNEEKGTLVEVSKFSNGEISGEITLFTSLKEFDPEKAKKKEEWLEGDKKKKVKAGNLRKVKRKIKLKNLSTTQFLQILEKYNAKTPVGENEGKNFIEEQEEKNNLSQGNYLQRNKDASAGGMLTLGQLYYIAKSGKDYFEDLMKERRDTQTAYALINSRLNFANRMGVQAMWKVIDGTVDTVKSKYMGVERRKWLAKNILAEGAKPKPHEVFAALMIVYDMGGTLYPDSNLQQFQGTKYRWFELVCNALGLDPKVEFINCYDKEAASREGSKEHIPEEELIKRLFKSHQETSLLVQSVGGGAKIWKMAEAGKEAQASKWAKEVIEESSEAAGRAKYMIAKFGSNEFEIALGAFPEVMNKSTSAEYLGVMFSYVVGGAPNYVHYSVSDKFKAHIYKGVAFNALNFCDNKPNADLYRDVVLTALKYRAKKWMSGAATMLEEYQNVISKVPRDPFQHVDEWSKDADRYKDIYEFWQKNYKVLQPILQGTDPLLQTAVFDTENIDSAGKQKIEKYLTTLNGYTQYMIEEGGLKKSAGSHIWSLHTLDVDNSMMYQMKGDDFRYRSMSGLLSALSFDPNTGVLSGADRESILRGQILGFMDQIRNNETFKHPSNQEYRRKQFEISYKEIRAKLTEKLNFDQSADQFNDKVRQKKYEIINILQKYGFPTDYHTLKIGEKDPAWKHIIDREVENAYNVFILGNSAPQAAQTTTSMWNRVNDVLSFSSNDENYRR